MMAQCRVCASIESAEYFQIFQKAGNLEKILYSCLQIEVSQETEPDAKVCSECEVHLRTTYEMKLRAIALDEIFQENDTINSLSRVVQTYLNERRKVNFSLEKLPGQLKITELSLCVKIEAEELAEHLENSENLQHILDPFCYEENKEDATLFKYEPEVLDAAVTIKDEDYACSSQFSSSDSDFLVTLKKIRSKKQVKKTSSTQNKTDKKTKLSKKFKTIGSPLPGSSKFYCFYCKKDFKSNRILFINHTNVHTTFKFIMNEMKLITCSKCTKMFKSDADLASHSLTTCKPPTKKSKIPCHYCNEKQETVEKLKEHMIFKHCDQLSCPVGTCQVQRLGYSKLYHHIRVHHPADIKTNNELFCTYCNDQFITIKELESHRMTDNNCIGKRFTCPDCGDKFGDSRLMNKHIVKENELKEFAGTTGEDRASIIEENKIKDAILKSHTCPRCGKKLGCLQSLKYHCRLCCPDSIIFKTTKNTFYCDICEKISNCTSIGGFRKHQEACKLIIISCRICSEKFENNSELKKHSKICYPQPSTNPKCLFCDKVFHGEKLSLYRHHLSMHVAFKFLFEKNYLAFHDCSNCNKTFSTEELLAQHGEECNSVVEENVHPCGDCDAVYESANTLKEHQFFKHFTYFVCPVSNCKSSYTKYGPFYFHMVGAHVGFIEPIKEFQCVYCNMLFTSFPLLDTHLRKQCSGKTIDCTHCDKKFGNIKTLKNHMRAVKNPVICDDCGKACFSKNDLVMHKRFHTGEKPHVCNVCQKRFATSSSRNTHLKSHMVDRVLPCDKCNYMGQSSVHLNKHKKDCHSGKYCCPLCSSVLSCIRSIETHLKIMHQLTPENIKKIKKQCVIIQPA